MLRLTLQSTDGTLFWRSATLPQVILDRSSFWSVATETCDSVEPLSIFAFNALNGFNHALTGSIHGRSCYLGFEENEKRHYFVKGIGWVWSNGWQLADGSYGLFPLWGAERERDFSLRFSEIGIDAARPEAIFLHGNIPDPDGTTIHPADSIPDLDGTPAKPCMYVYSSPVRWRIADLSFLSDKERSEVWAGTKDKREWLHLLLHKLGKTCRCLHEHGGYDYSLSTHNSFTDGTRIDFEYAVLLGHPHKEERLNEDIETWKDKEVDGLREIAWYLADLMRLDISGKELNKWWSDTYYE